MIDPDVYNLFAYQKARHDEVENETDMEKLPERLGCTLVEADQSRLVGTEIHVKRKQHPLRRRSDIAHELSHKLARERGKPEYPTYEEVIQHRHSSVPNIRAHVESIITVGQDALLIPDGTVQEAIELHGLTAQMVWVLHQEQKVLLHEALRRVVHHNQNARLGGFVAIKGKIRYAYSFRWHMPCWIGDPMPDPDDDFQGEGVSLFEVPGYPSMTVGLVVIEE
ncbi:ImmA/IrrE family metallo-endopeptidase [Deinococcus multiflagellatus]|uniref:ImmA/IrrE family metallo-endopeptidase n=1 Tax=Deinococcus multiflagellatus TaxID=1656887 RepID=A0ABW1ZIF4_9DEIO|nr:ImmA/IrrE family metallo-endopeptidase [Deinococcus multiflagellatus]MBZ9712230.1 ImmA/IrrE family metallo-endopeptidase [Deinococcus multiflagellatus]